MAKHRRKSKARIAIASATATGAAAAALVGASPASAATITSQYIISQPHAVQRACAERILAAQGPGAWSAWAGSLDNMMAESGDSDTAINPSSGAAGYYQIMPSTWADLCSDLGGSSVAPSAAVGGSSAGSGVVAAEQQFFDSVASRGLAVDGVCGWQTQQAEVDFHNLTGVPLSDGACH